MARVTLGPAGSVPYERPVNCFPAARGILTSGVVQFVQGEPWLRWAPQASSAAVPCNEWLDAGRERDFINQFCFYSGLPPRFDWNSPDIFVKLRENAGLPSALALSFAAGVGAKTKPNSVVNVMVTGATPQPTKQKSYPTLNQLTDPLGFKARAAQGGALYDSAARSISAKARAAGIFGQRQGAPQMMSIGQSAAAQDANAIAANLQAQAAQLSQTADVRAWDIPAAEIEAIRQQREARLVAAGVASPKSNLKFWVIGAAVLVGGWWILRG